ncbi:MAG: cyclophilin-like family protein [Pseudomonadota bacterium]
MPTRARRTPAPPNSPPQPTGAETHHSSRDQRFVQISAGAQSLVAKLINTPTADWIWRALPVFSTVEMWGRGAIHFETHIETGREANARWIIAPGAIGYWVEQDRVVIGFDETPLSRPGEIRLPARCNIWARAVGEVTPLVSVRPGERVVMQALDVARQAACDNESDRARDTDRA